MSVVVMAFHLYNVDSTYDLVLHFATLILFFLAITVAIFVLSGAKLTWTKMKQEFKGPIKKGSLCRRQDFQIYARRVKKLLAVPNQILQP